MASEELIEIFLRLDHNMLHPLGLLWRDLLRGFPYVLAIAICSNVGGLWCDDRIFELCAFRHRFPQAACDTRRVDVGHELGLGEIAIL